MSRTMFSLLIISVVITGAALTTWVATGRHPYTKYQEVTREQFSAGADDPFAGTGFYDGSIVTKTVKKNVFYFGLLPAPQGLFDKHAVSVASVVVPVWLIQWLILGGFVLMRQRLAKIGEGRISMNDLTVRRPVLNSSDPSQT